MAPFDNLEFISIYNQTTDFPAHFHETFCISLIHSGVEKIEMEQQTLYSEAGSISITNPYEVHANPLILGDMKVHFDTIYVSQELMRYLMNGKNSLFNDRKINDHRSNFLFLRLKEAMDQQNLQNTAYYLRQFAHSISPYAHYRDEAYTPLHGQTFDNINAYIEQHICDKFCLDELSRMANINKFGFVKKFKASTGMTPMNFVLMKKIFASKQAITRQSSLSEIAYTYNFTDLAHFSRTFKRYIGISPKAYQEHHTLNV